MGLTPDLLSEHFSSLDSWTDGDTGDAESKINPAGQLELDTNNSAADNRWARRTKTIVPPPDKFTIEIKTYLNAIGTLADNDGFLVAYYTATWFFMAQMNSDGLYITKAAGVKVEVGTDIVLCNAGAAWQTWRFQVDKSAGEASATVEVFLNNVSQGTFDCDREIAGTGGNMLLVQFGWGNNDRISHVDYIRIASGLGPINDTDNTTIDIF
jgi:hypothetical protein